MFEEEEDPTNRSFFSEIISSISDVKFSHDGRYILSRDYLSLKIWDVNMESKPVKTIPIHDHLRGKLCDLYENDCIFDKFECTWGGDDKYVTPPSRHCRAQHVLHVLCARCIESLILMSDPQACSNWIVPQLLPDIRLRHAERRGPAGGQVRVQGEEDWWTPTWKQARRRKERAARWAEGEHGCGHSGL